MTLSMAKARWQLWRIVVQLYIFRRYEVHLRTRHAETRICNGCDFTSDRFSDVGRLPFNNADLWQLHQFYFSPPPVEHEQHDKDVPATPNVGIAPPPPTPTIATPTSDNQQGLVLPDGAVSFQTLGLALSESGLLQSSTHSLKRPSSPNDDIEKDNHVTKKPKSLKPRIAYYPRIMVRYHPRGLS